MKWVENKVSFRIGLEIVNQGLKLTIGMVVTDGIARLRPDMLLRVESGQAGGK